MRQASALFVLALSARADEFAGRVAAMTGVSKAKAAAEVEASIERLFAYGAWADEGGFDLEPFPAFRRWKARVAAQPGHLATRYPYSIDPHASRDL